MSIKLLLIFIVTIIILLIVKSLLIYIYENSSVVYKNESNINVQGTGQVQNNLINRGQPPDEVLVKNTDIQPIDFSKIEFTEFNLDKPKQRKSLYSTGCTVIPLGTTK